MILCDTGVIIGAIDQDDSKHAFCVEVLRPIRTRLITSWPCLTESMYLLGEHVGPNGQEKLRRQIEAGVFAIHEASIDEALRACVLMRKYADSPMDFADASLVAAAETLGIDRILTIDGHFYAYLIDDQHPFTIVALPT